MLDGHMEKEMRWKLEMEIGNGKRNKKRGVVFSHELFALSLLYFYTYVAIVIRLAL